MYYNDYNRMRDEEPIHVDSFLVDGQGPAPKKKKKHSGLKITALCLACALLGGVGGVAAGRVIPTRSTTIYTGEHPPVAVSMSNVTTDQPMTGAQVYAANVGAAVGITTELVTTNFWGQRVKGATAGSGFVISRDGYILTNYHVINGASSIRVAFVDGTTYDATLVGGEEANDVAVLKIEADDLQPVVLGDSDNLVVGEQVCAIGNPLGELTFTYTSGSVSAKDRAITMENGEIVNMLQTDTAINSGNSGGPLFNMYGQVIGITTAKARSSSSSAIVEGIGFAIPINDVRDMVKDIMEKGYVSGKPHVGIVMKNVSSEAIAYGIPSGAYVAAVLEDSCADQAGLRTGDIITAVDSAAVASREQLKSAVKNYKAGDTVVFTVFRDGEYLELNITLDEVTKERDEAMAELQSQYQEAQQQQQQQQQVPSNGFGNWPFGIFGW